MPSLRHDLSSDFSRYFSPAWDRTRDLPISVHVWCIQYILIILCFQNYTLPRDAQPLIRLFMKNSFIYFTIQCISDLGSFCCVCAEDRYNGLWSDDPGAQDDYLLSSGSYSGKSCAGCTCDNAYETVSNCAGASM